MDLQLQEKVVLITGGAKGIGAAIVRAAAAEGGIPVIVDRDADAARHLHREIIVGDVIVADISAAQACYSVIQHTIEKFGRLDSLVNNAGINDKVGLEHGSPEHYVASLERNLLHYYNMAHFALPHLKNLGSPAGRLPLTQRCLIDSRERRQRVGGSDHGARKSRTGCRNSA